MHISSLDTDTRLDRQSLQDLKAEEGCRLQHWRSRGPGVIHYIPIARWQYIVASVDRHGLRSSPYRVLPGAHLGSHSSRWPSCWSTVMSHCSLRLKCDIFPAPPKRKDSRNSRNKGRDLQLTCRSVREVYVFYCWPVHKTLSACRSEHGRCKICNAGACLVLH